MRDSSLPRIVAATALAVVGLLGSACGSQPAASPQPSSSPPTSSPVVSGGTPQPCPRLTPAAPVGDPAVVLTTAALQSATVVVDPGAGSPTCSQLRSGETVHLLAGQRVEFVANRAPTVAGVPPAAGTSAVSMATAPVPSSTGPPTRHVVVTVTAVQPGTVKLTWTDCSGTRC